jgi:hypothetical protein
MKVAATGVFVVGFALCLGTQASGAGHIRLNPASGHESRGRGGERRVYLEPHQGSEQVEVSGGCLTFLTEVRFSLALPFGRSVESVLPAGTSWFLPPGRYTLDNPTEAPVELLLNTSGVCGDVSP